MDLLSGNIKKIYLKYFLAAFGSTLIMSIYSLIDTIVIGQYEGPNGTAAIATFWPMWTILFAFGLLLGIGGSVHMAQQKGAGQKKEGDRYYSATWILAIIISAAIFLIYNLFSEPMLWFFGARGEVLELAKRYAFCVSLTSPSFLLGQFLIPFIRNDDHPTYTTVAVLSGGIFNVFGDFFFVFGLDMGIFGAGLATALGQLICLAILIAYLPSKKCRLRFDREIFSHAFLKRCRQIITMGTSNFVIDIAMGVLAILFNNQALALYGAAGLAVYGVITSLSTMVQTFGYAVGESAQAIMSTNYGAGKWPRVRETFRISSVTAFMIGIICCLVGLAIPIPLTRLFMTVTPEVLAIAPSAIRLYSIAFVFLLFNVASTYYFQSIGKPGMSLLISLLRGIILSGICILALPALFGTSAIWLAIPVTEAVVMLLVIWRARK